MTQTLTDTALRKWLFCGHWDNDAIDVEYAIEVTEDNPDPTDLRVDTGYWEQGLWADFGTGYTIEEAEAAAVIPFHHDLDHDEDAEDTRGSLAEHMAALDRLSDCARTGPRPAYARALAAARFHGASDEQIKDAHQYGSAKAAVTPCFDWKGLHA